MSGKKANARRKQVAASVPASDSVLREMRVFMPDRVRPKQDLSNRRGPRGVGKTLGSQTMDCASEPFAAPPLRHGGLKEEAIKAWQIGLIRRLRTRTSESDSCHFAKGKGWHKRGLIRAPIRSPTWYKESWDKLGTSLLTATITASATRELFANVDGRADEFHVPHLPLEGLLKPPFPGCNTMTDALAADRVRIADLGSQILGLERSLATLRKERDLAQKRLDSYTYPVSNVSNAIVAEIFIHFLPPYPLRPFRGPLSPTVLTQICCKWREIALACPTLWRAISLPSHCDSPQVLEMSEQWLSRSGCGPLSIEIDGLFSPSPELLAITHRARWEYLRTWFCPASITSRHTRRGCRYPGGSPPPHPPDAEKFLGEEPIEALASFISRSGCTLQLLRITSQCPRVSDLRLYRSAFPSIKKIEFKKEKPLKDDDSEDLLITCICIPNMRLPLQCAS
ncbi:hypothetical protein B0H14DRAFT_2556821 [Mycena olivaceomarginata]|nr:hypothetical protein B0H14DRAFT_2556821 [Mycena olivaceomarginata]